MTAPRKNTTITVLGRRYVVGGELEPEYVERLAGRVEAMLEALQESAPGQDNEQLAVLTALNLADELENFRDQPAPRAEPQETRPPVTALPPQLQPRLARCVRLLESALEAEVK